MVLKCSRRFREKEKWEYMEHYEKRQVRVKGGKKGHICFVLLEQIVTSYVSTKNHVSVNDLISSGGLCHCPW